MLLLAIFLGLLSGFLIAILVIFIMDHYNAEERKQNIAFCILLPCLWVGLAFGMLGMDYALTKTETQAIQAKVEYIQELKDSKDGNAFDQITITNETITLNNKIIRKQITSKKWYANPFCRNLWDNVELIH